MTDFSDARDAIWASHGRLLAAAGSLTEAQLAGPSYCKDWPVAQLLSHIGSGAEISGLLLDSAIATGEFPAREAQSEIWDRWNAMTPEEQGRNALIADEAFLKHVDAMPERERDSLALNFFGTPVDAPFLLRMRLAEHAIHTWDLVVMGDRDSTIPTDAATLIVDSLGLVAGHSGRTAGGPIEVDVITTDPDRAFRLSVAEAVTLSPEGTGSATGRVRLPAEALIRLVYGRLDPDHTPSTVSADRIELSALRATFAGI
jgi:uncharacterized protein (TIGR03083 family)